MSGQQPRYAARFYRSASGTEPVREWLQAQNKDTKLAVGHAIRLLQYRWPLGMPLVRKMDNNLWELRVDVRTTTIRVFFTLAKSCLVLLHVFEKQSQKTPAHELKLARQRLAQLKRSE